MMVKSSQFSIYCALFSNAEKTGKFIDLGAGGWGGTKIYSSIPVIQQTKIKCSLARLVKKHPIKNGFTFK